MVRSLLSLVATGVHRLLSLPLRLVLHGLGRLRVGRRAAVRLSVAPGREGDSQHHRLELIEALETLGDDPRVAEIILDIDELAGGWAGVQDLQRCLERVARTDTRVTAHVHGGTLRTAALLPHLDHAALTPTAELLVTGLGTRLSFYTDALDLVGVEMQVESAGRFKSFGESWIRSFPTTENRTQLQELLGDLQDQLIESVERARPGVGAALQGLLGTAPQSPEQAQDAGIVDALAYPDQLEEEREQTHGSDLRVLSYRRYAWSRGWARALGRRQLGWPAVAVVHLEGSIIMEDSAGRGGTIAARSVVPVLKRLARSSAVRAVVLSVNSPGGSALASDLIARAVRKLGEKKPVVAVFGDVSASGGYYLSAPAAEIIARPATITGSIGVVGGKPVFAAALQRLGIRQETIAAGPDVGMFGPFAPFTDDQRRRYQESIARAYDRFLGVVSAGRRMPREAVHAVAQGRVWTGRQALEHGLIDQLGDLRTAIDRARTLADLPTSRGPVAHLRFTPPRWKVALRALSGAQLSADPLALAARWLPELKGVMTLLPELQRAPMQPLAWLPVAGLED